MKTSELLKEFLKNKIFLVRHGAVHYVYFSPITQAYITVPRHAKEIKTGTLKNIRKQAGLE